MNLRERSFRIVNNDEPRLHCLFIKVFGEGSVTGGNREIELGMAQSNI